MTKALNTAHHAADYLMKGPASFAVRHPYLFMGMGFVALPMGLISGIMLLTLAVSIPFGWL